MYIKNILLLSFFSLISMLSAAQTFNIQGTVRDVKRLPIPGVTVKISGGAGGAATDENGKFIIPKMAPGKYKLMFSAVGYKSTSREVSVGDFAPVNIQVVMEESSTNIQGVTVNGRSVIKETNRQAYNITAIDAKKLYNSTLNLADAMDKVAGIRVRESGGVGSNFNLSLNGFSGNHVRFFIDGIPMDNFGSSFQINNVPINIAERVEVYKGVVPVWLGSDALGGAVNIITGDRYRNYLDVSYSYGSFNTHRTVLNFAATSKTGYTVQLNAFQNYSDNDYKVKVDAADIYTGAYKPGSWLPRFHDQYHNETLIANVGVVDKPFADKLLLGVTLGKNYKEIQTGARMVSVFGGWHRRGTIIMPTLKYKKTDLIKGMDVTLNANYNLGTEQNIDTMNVRYDWYGNSKPNGSSGERSRSMYKYSNNNGIASAMVNYKPGDNQNIALSNVFTTFNRKGKDPINPEVEKNELPKKTQKNIMGLGYTYDVKDEWSASVFGKYIYMNNNVGNSAAVNTANKLGYGIAAAYFISPALQVKASYELTNRMPEAQEIFGDLENQEGNPSLKPEQSNNANLGLSYNFAAGENNRFAIMANGVYRQSKNFIYNRLNNNQSKLVADNRDGVQTVGADGDVRYSYKNWLTAGATVTYQYLTNTQKYEPGYSGISPLYKDQMPNIPYLFGNADLGVNLHNVGGKSNTLTLGYNLLYVHSFYLYWPSRGGDKLNIPVQLSHDINAVYSLKNGRYNIGVEARNITNELLYDNFSLQKPGRAFYMNLRYFINKPGR